MQAPFFTFCHLHRLCKHHFLHFAICIGYASIKTLIFTFAERRCVFGMVGAVACVPARTSAQRRFHTKMRCCHPQTLHFHPRMMRIHVQTLCFHPRLHRLTMDAPSWGALAGTQARPLPCLTATSTTFLQNHSSFRNARRV